MAETTGDFKKSPKIPQSVYMSGTDTIHHVAPFILILSV